jgi:hypothetical protein
MKTFILSALFLLFATSELFSQKVAFMQITSVESVVGAGAGRSKLIITKDDGTQEEKEMENLFSMVGINFKNVKTNESLLLQTLKSYTDLGWKLVSTTPLTLSPNQNANGIFLTRYLLQKEQ